MHPFIHSLLPSFLISFRSSCLHLFISIHKLFPGVIKSAVTFVGVLYMRLDTGMLERRHTWHVLSQLRESLDRAQAMWIKRHLHQTCS